MHMTGAEEPRWGRGTRRRDRVLCVGAVMVGITIP